MEELKVILEAVVSLGGEAKWLFILWLLEQFIEELIIVTLFGGIAYAGYKLIRNWQKHEFDR